MRHNYEIQKDGYKVDIVVDVYTTDFKEVSYRIVNVGIKEKGKRKFDYISHRIHESYEYRRRDYDEREAYAREKYLEYITEEDVKNALEYAYSQMKPDISKVVYRVF